MTKISFVRENSLEAPGDYWDVKPSGDDMADCRTGHRLADEFADAVASGDVFPGLLSYILQRQCELARTSQLEIGFAWRLQEIIADGRKD